MMAMNLQTSYIHPPLGPTLFFPRGVALAPFRYVERQNLMLCMGSKRFARLSNGFSKKLECHLAAVSLHVAFYNFCRTHEELRMTPAMALRIMDHAWSIGELIEAALKAVPTKPTQTPAQRRKSFRVIQGDLFD
jgi:hypothetical protein